MMTEQHPELEAEMAKAILRPYGERILVQDPPAEQQSGIIIPVEAQALRRGVVVAVPEEPSIMHGQQEDGKYAGLKVGDVIRYRPNCGDEVDGMRLLDLDCIRIVES